MKKTNNDIIFLNLPPPPDNIKDQLIEHCMSINIDMSKVEWMNNFFDNEIPIAAQEYGNGNTGLSKSLKESIISIYQPFFLSKIDVIVAKTKNLLTVSSSTPPHCDRFRCTAINFLLNSGGRKVTTTFYNERRYEKNPTSAINCKYNQVTYKSSWILPEHRWHIFDAQRYHSVENIEKERYLLSILLLNNLEYVDFIKNYNCLIVNNRVDI